MIHVTSAYRSILPFRLVLNQDNYVYNQTFIYIIDIKTFLLFFVC